MWKLDGEDGMLGGGGRESTEKEQGRIAKEVRLHWEYRAEELRVKPSASTSGICAWREGYRVFPVLI